MGKPSLSDKPRKKGFSVGPANLPDGTYKRKVDKIKKSLIHNAKVKKSFAKTISKDTSDADPHALRAKRLLEEATVEREQAKSAEIKDGEDATTTATNTEMHPERQAALDQPEAPRVEKGEDAKNGDKGTWRKREKRKKTSAFFKEEREAARLREEREEKERQIKAREVAAEKARKERALRKKVMSARTAKGQQKLGRQSTLLLEKVKAQIGA